MTIIFGLIAIFAILVMIGFIWSIVRARQVEQIVPPPGHVIEIDGKQIHYTDSGSGDPILLIHGLAGNSRNFSYQLSERLAARHRVIVVDRPGSGYSDTMPGAFSLIAQARLFATLIERLALDRPLVVGHSLGGAVSLTLAVTHPGKIRGLALIAPLTRVVETPPAAFRTLEIRSAVARRFIASVVAVPLSAINAAKSAKAVFAPETPPADFGERGGGLLVQRPGAIFTASTELTEVGGALSPIVARYSEITLPVSILYGRSDEILDPALHGETLPALIPQARITLIEGGHMILVTAPEATATWIEQCVAGP